MDTHGYKTNMSQKDRTACAFLVAMSRNFPRALHTTPVGQTAKDGNTRSAEVYVRVVAMCAPVQIVAFSYLTIYHSAVPYISVHTSTPPKPEEFPGVRTKLRPIQNARLVGGSQPSALPNAAAALLAIFPRTTLF